MKKHLNLFMLFSLAFLFTTCGTTTQLRKSSSDPSLGQNPEEPFKKIFVMVKAKSDQTKREAEDKLVSLIKKGEAVQSYTYLSPSDTSQKELVEKLISDGFDGVLTMRVKAVVQTKTKTRNTATSYETWYSYGNGYVYSSYTYNIDNSDKSTPNVDVTGDKDYIVETNIYSLREKKLLWSGVTASMSAKKVDSALTGISNTVRKELKKKGFLQSA